MATTSDITGNPIVVTGTTGTSEKITDSMNIYVKMVYWYNPTGAGDLLSLTDKNGNALVPARCEVANESQWLPVFSSFSGIYVDDMDSGTLYIYTK